MALIRRRTAGATPAGAVSSTPTATLDADGEVARKGRPTPTRAQARAQRLAQRSAAGSSGSRTVRGPRPSDPKAARRMDRLERADRARKARESLRSTDITKLPPREQVPARVIARDIVDSRLNVGSLALPVMGLILLVGFIPVTVIQTSAYGLVWAVVLGLFIDSFFIHKLVSRAIAERAPGNTTKVRIYATARSIQPRRFRVPPPRIKRGDALPPYPGERRR